jgi:NAD(P)-dependent dehydrogenase (short-subunit alcohol dehydrogenase family)
VVTGGNSGIGFAAAQALAAHGAQVVIAVRNADKGRAAVESIRRAHSEAAVEVMALDLSDLRSVRDFAEALRGRYGALDLLINNAGVMALPYRQTVDGFELQFGTNHLGHFALTGLLLPLVLAAPGARVVTVSSGLHTRGKAEFDDLKGEAGYDRWAAYGKSKLANLLFAYELQRRLAASGSSVISVGCHPGYAATNLQAAGPNMSGSRVGAALAGLGNRLFAQSGAMGALPTLYAATAADVNGCDYIGPTGWGGMRGFPGKVRSNSLSYDTVAARRLWQISEDATGVHYELPATPE